MNRNLSKLLQSLAGVIMLSMASLSMAASKTKPSTSLTCILSSELAQPPVEVKHLLALGLPPPALLSTDPFQTPKPALVPASKYAYALSSST